MFDWLRKIPHPKYGKCGGASRDCSTHPPLDEIDQAFEKHDQELYEASLLPEEKQKGAKKIADVNLGIRLRQADPKKLKWKGRIYRRLAMLVFNGKS